MEITPVKGGLKQKRDKHNNITTTYSALHTILPPQLNKIPARHKVMCGSQCCISTKSKNSSLLTWHDCYLEKLKDQSHKAQNRRPGETTSCIFETYKNYVRPHGCRTHRIASIMTMAKMCLFPSDQRYTHHWKCMLQCCDKCQRIAAPIQE